MNEQDEPVVIGFESVLASTEKAWLIKFHDRQEWLPKSQCTIHEETEEVEMPNWLYLKKF